MWITKLCVAGRRTLLGASMLSLLPCASCATGVCNKPFPPLPDTGRYDDARACTTGVGDGATVRITTTDVYIDYLDAAGNRWEVDYRIVGEE